MKAIFKKNQVMITAMAIMLAIAGYLQFAGKNLEEEYLSEYDGEKVQMVDSEGVITEQYTADEQVVNEEFESIFDLSEEDILAENRTDIASLDTDVELYAPNYAQENMDTVAKATPDAGEIPGEAVFTASTGLEILTDAKLLKEQTRAKNKETLMEIINSGGIAEEQKQTAIDNMVQMTAVAEKEAAAEILLEAKGFSDVVVSVNGEAADVVVNALSLSDAQRAQIEDIVTRKTQVPAENIIISTVVE